jgi:hypothetical protein
MKFLPGFSNPMCHKHPTLSHRDLPTLPFLHVLVNPKVFSLLNIILDDFVDRNIKNLDIASTATRDDRSSNIQLCKFVALTRVIVAVLPPLAISSP